MALNALNYGSDLFRDIVLTIVLPALFTSSSQLNNTKDVENRMTLLHYLAEVVEKKHPELLGFMDEISHVERAAKVGSHSHQ